MWGAIYQELWAREEKLIAVKWGTAGFEEVEKDRFVRVAATVRVCVWVSGVSAGRYSHWQF